MQTDHWNIPGSTVEIYQDIFIPAMIGEWVSRVLSLADRQPGEQVLDVACGTGVLTRAAADMVGQNGSVIGVDISPDILSLARKLTDGRFSAIEWRECDAQNLSFEDSFFEVAFCQLGLMFIPDKVMALKEMKRVLKTDGRLALMVWGAIKKSPGQTVIAKIWEKHLGAEHAAGFYRMHSMNDPDNLRSLLESSDFQEIVVKSTKSTMRFPAAEHHVRSYGAMVRFPANEVQQPTVIREVTQAMQDYVSSDGLLFPIKAVLGKARKVQSFIH